MITVTGPGRVLLDYGPAQLAVRVEGAQDLTAVAEGAARFAAGLIDELAPFRAVAARPQRALGDTGGLPAVLRRMIEAVESSGDDDLTPMAAVAGSVADLTADWAFGRGAGKVVVNNGGDIAIRLQPPYSVKVGVAPALGADATHCLYVTAGDGIGGIATSGFGGRSFTKGIATAAVAAARSAAIADACATSIGNAAFAPHPAIRLAPAEELDPGTDIAGHLVVNSIGELPDDVLAACLNRAGARAAALLGGGMIVGSAVFIRQWGVMVPENFMHPLGHINHEEGLRWKSEKS